MGTMESPQPSPVPPTPSTLADLQRDPAAAPPDGRGTLPIAVSRTRTFDTPEFAGMTFPWSINPYRGCSHACTYCFARPTHAYLNLSPLDDFERTVVVKTNVAEVLRRELARRSWKGEHVAMGTNTDPYQRCEGRYRLMPGIIRALAESYTPFSVLTKGTLITRDLDELVAARRKVPVTAAMTIGMLDEQLWRDAEPGTPSPAARLRAVRQLNDAGIPTGIMLAPIMPGLNDDPEQLSALVEAAARASHMRQDRIRVLLARVAALVQLLIARDQLGVTRLQPGQEELTDAGTQVQHDRGDVRGAGARGRLHQRAELLWIVVEARHDRRQHDACLLY